MAYCARSGLVVGAVIVDDGQTSRVPLAQRPAGQELAARIASGDVTDVVDHAQSRLFRDSEEAIRVARGWVALGVTLHLLDSGGALDLASPDGELAYGIKAVVDQHEVRRLRKRVSDAMLHVASEGCAPAGTVYGYQRVNKRLEVVPEEAGVVREVFRRALGGQGAMTIARVLTQAGVPRRGVVSPWPNQRVRRMLACPVYCGRFWWRGEMHEGDHEPIILPEDWERVQALLGVRTRSRGNAVQYLTGLYRCATCGGPAVIWTRDQGQAGQHYLHCWQARMGATACKRTLGRLEAVDAVVWRQTEMLLADGDLREGLKLYRAQVRRGTGRQAELEARLREVERLQLEAVEAAQAGLMTWEVLASLNRPRVEEADKLRAQLGALPDDAGEAALAVWAQWGAVRALRDARERWTVEEQLLALRAVYQHVEVGGGEVRFVFVLPTLEPVVRALPRYWAPGRGCISVGF